MQNAPTRQPRVSPAASGVGRAWATTACLVGAVILAGAVILPPFAAGYLLPSRSIATPPRPSAQPSAPAGSWSVAVETASAETRPPTSTANTGHKPDDNVATRDSDLPLGAAPANEPPRGTVAAGGAPAGSSLATGVFASRTSPEIVTAEPPIELVLPAIPPLSAAPAEARPAVSPPPARREPLPLQTDLLPTEMPGPSPLAKPGPDRHG